MEMKLKSQHQEKETYVQYFDRTKFVCLLVEIRFSLSHQFDIHLLGLSLVVYLMKLSQGYGFWNDRFNDKPLWGMNDVHPF